MKIGMVIDTISPFYVGGYEKRAFELAKRLATLHDVTVFTSLQNPAVIDSVRFVPIRPQVATFGQGGYRKASEALRFAGATSRLAMSALDLDIVDCNATPFAHVLPARLVARRAGAAFVLTSHEALRGTLREFSDHSPRWARDLRHLALVAAYRSAHQSADLVVAASEFAQAGLLSEGISRVHVTHGGVSHLGRPKSNYNGRLTTLGRLVPIKRVDAVIQAFATLYQRGQAEQLTIIGTGPMRLKLMELVRCLRLEAHVHFVGSVSDERRDAMLTDETDVIVSGSPREGLSIATLEGLAAGNPAIVTSNPAYGTNGALEYIVSGFNGVVTTGHPDAIARAIIDVTVEGNVYEAMSKAAIATAQGYTWDVAAHELERIYQDALGIGA